MTDNIKVVRLTQDYQFKSFDCGNQDLNDFLLTDNPLDVERGKTWKHDKWLIPMDKWTRC